ncbi:GNAT family N-acetyltransferase [Formosa sp. 3Alg 14/1]|uniref:GNAT family N-acetyltransferase n=1 Tax=unclassified Formosa TaxID=2644710 RepID=UPI0039BDC3C3
MSIATTERLHLEELTLNDAPFLLELLNTPNWIKYIGDRNIKSVADAEQALTNTYLKSYRDHGFGFFKVLLKSDNSKAIGCCGLIKRPELEGVDIGFAFLPEYERKGYGFESATAVLEIAKEKFKLDEVLAIVLPTNPNSIKLLEKLGMTYRKTVSPFETKEALLLYSKTFD